MILVLAEQINGSFKKKTFEVLQYAATIAQKNKDKVVALVLGSAQEDAMQALGAYGAQEVWHVNDARFDSFSAKAFAKAIQQIATQHNATMLIAPHDVCGKAVAPRVAAVMQAGMVAGAVAYPTYDNGFELQKSVFSGKAFTTIAITSAFKVITLVPNTFSVVKGEGQAAIQVMQVAIQDADFATKVNAVEKVTGTIPLGEAELVVSGGRGMKGPENWHLIEDLAKVMGAATACSRPVADSHWRPHHEHVGQTGGTIRPNLYIAIGISGAIQHLAGVNSSKTIVVINKDPEAPFFKAADYGIVGDALEVLPKLTAAMQKFKATN
ncbi:MAG: electron transfer flavoprotein subunit alpha/FixB family protein [Bacteroidota bacterium]|jgi:electron transfer flavoprotein alpha subunit|nr:electron transfer flavoprotein subunit alpha/FixB family protein [Bacteroidota bacterium]